MVTQIGNDTIYQTVSDEFMDIPELGISSEDRRILVIDSSKPVTNSKTLVVPRVIKQGGVQIDLLGGQTIAKAEFAEKNKVGDKSFKEVFGYQQVLDGNHPYQIPIDKVFNGEPVFGNVYKLVNLLGDGMYAAEHYGYPKQSVTNNRTRKTDEIADSVIITALDLQEYGILPASENAIAVEPAVPGEQLSMFDENWDSEENNCSIPF
jgi:hypothetical protein